LDIAADLQRLNEFTASQYAPDFLLIEAPKQNIWDAIKEDHKQKEHEIAKAQAVNAVAFQVQQKSTQTTQTSIPVSTTTSQSKVYSSPSSSSGYSWTTTKEKTADEIVESEFKDIRDMAYRMAEEEMRTPEAKRKSCNPQVLVLAKKKRGIIPWIQESFEDGSWKKKALLIVAMIATKSLASILFDMRAEMRRERK